MGKSNAILFPAQPQNVATVRTLSAISAFKPVETTRTRVDVIEFFDLVTTLAALLVPRTIMSVRNHAASRR